MSGINWAPVRKIVATALGAVTSAGLIAIGHAFGWQLDPTVAAIVVGLVSTLAGYLTPDTAALPVPAVPPVSPTP